MLEYSRDSMAAPLRELAGVLVMIRQRGFKPDLTRSGRWGGQVPAHDDEDASSAPASSSSASDVDDVENEHVEADGALHDVLSFESEIPACYVVYHNRNSKRRHVADGEGRSAFVCGRAVSDAFDLGGSAAQPLCRDCVKFFEEGQGGCGGCP